MLGVASYLRWRRGLYTSLFKSFLFNRRHVVWPCASWNCLNKCIWECWLFPYTVLVSYFKRFVNFFDKRLHVLLRLELYLTPTLRVNFFKSRLGCKWQIMLIPVLIVFLHLALENFFVHLVYPTWSLSSIGVGFKRIPPPRTVTKAMFILKTRKKSYYPWNVYWILNIRYFAMTGHYPILKLKLQIQPFLLTVSMSVEFCKSACDDANRCVDSHVRNNAPRCFDNGRSETWVGLPP